MRYFVTVTKQEILVIHLNVFFDATSRRHNDVIQCVPVYSACYVKLWGLATKIRF